MLINEVAGGTVRDLLLGLPVFWAIDPTPIALRLFAVGAVHFTAHLVASRYRLLLWLDALGMALVTVAGAAKAADVGAGTLIAIVMGVITASDGGIIRDILGQEAALVMRREIYVTASALGATIFVAALINWRASAHCYGDGSRSSLCRARPRDFTGLAATCVSPSSGQESLRHLAWLPEHHRFGSSFPRCDTRSSY